MRIKYGKGDYEAIKKMVDTKQTSLVEKARLYAIERHDFVRATYGGGSYAIHLTIVDEIGTFLRKMGCILNFGKLLIN